MLHGLQIIGTLPVRFRSVCAFLRNFRIIYITHIFRSIAHTVRNADSGGATGGFEPAEQLAQNARYQHIERHSYKHSDYAEQIAHYSDGYNNSERADTDRVAEDLRTDNITVKLLNDNNDNNKQYQLCRVGDKHEKRTRYKSEYRSEERDYIRHADNNTDKLIMRDADDHQRYERNYSYNKRIEQLSDNKSAEGLVRKNGIIDKGFRSPFRQQRAHELFAAVGKALLCKQKIYRDDRSDNDILHRSEKSGKK